MGIILFAFVFMGINFAYGNFQNIAEEKNLIKETNKEEIYEKTETEENIEEKMKEYSKVQNVWQIEIPKVNLLATISEGTSQEVMLRSVGHFEDTAFWNGNVGLAAHNRRIPNKLF